MSLTVGVKIGISVRAELGADVGEVAWLTLGDYEFVGIAVVGEKVVVVVGHMD